MTNQKIERILIDNKTSNVFHTHVSMGRVRGKYSFNRETIEEFWNIYKVDADLSCGIAEKPQAYLPILGDIDIKLLDENKELKIIHTEKHVKEVIQVYQSVLKKIVDDITDTQLTCVLLEKPLYHVTKNDKTHAKHGFHIHFPSCFLSKQDQEEHLLPRVQEELKRLETFSDIGVEDSSLMIDKACCKVPWLLYGAVKDTGMKPYLVSKVFDYELKEMSLEDAFKDYKLYDLKEKEIKIAEKVEEYLPRILSILPYSRYTSEVKNGLISPIKQKEYEKQSKNYKVMYESDESESFQPLNIDEIKSLVNMLSTTRADDRREWLEVGWCLHGISQGSSQFLDIWHEFSKRSDKYDETICNNLWEKITIDKIKIGSLHYWAKTDNYDEYRKYIINSKGVQNIIGDSLNGSHYDIAKLFMNSYGFDNIKISDNKTLSFFGWNQKTKLWEDGTKENLMKIASETLFPIYKNKSEELFKLLENCPKSDKEQEGVLNAGIKQSQKMLSNLKSAPYISNVCKSISGYSHDKDFESKVINKSIYELPIKGGKIINLETLDIRDRNRTDYFSFELDVNFLGEDHDFDKVVIPFFKSITCNSDSLIDYHRRLWGYMMTGSISDRSLHIMWGNGCNGKSSLINIFKKIMGNFAVNLDEDTMIKKSSGGAKPEMMDLLHSRCGIMPESEKEEKINSKRVKTITGDDTISARHLFGHIVKFNTQCKPVWPTNFKPEIDIQDQAILDRLKLIPFLGRFEKNKKNTDYIKDLQETKADDFFTWFCTGARDWITGQELIPCNDMNNQMDMYIKDNNPIIDFLEETYDIITREEYDKLSDIDKTSWRYKKTDMFTEYNAWKELNQRRPFKKIEFNKIVDNKMDEIKVKGLRFYTCRVKQVDITEEV